MNEKKDPLKINVKLHIIYLMQLSEKLLNTDTKRQIIIVEKEEIYSADKSIIKVSVSHLSATTTFFTANVNKTIKKN